MKMQIALSPKRLTNNGQKKKIRYFCTIISYAMGNGILYVSIFQIEHRNKALIDGGKYVRNKKGDCLPPPKTN